MRKRTSKCKQVNALVRSPYPDRTVAGRRRANAGWFLGRWVVLCVGGEGEGVLRTQTALTVISRQQHLVGKPGHRTRPANERRSGPTNSNCQKSGRAGSGGRACLAKRARAPTGIGKAARQTWSGRRGVATADSGTDRGRTRALQWLWRKSRAPMPRKIRTIRRKRRVRVRQIDRDNWSSARRRSAGPLAGAHWARTVLL